MTDIIGDAKGEIADSWARVSRAIWTAIIDLVIFLIGPSASLVSGVRFSLGTKMISRALASQLYRVTPI
jgi:hypothetical protein